MSNHMRSFNLPVLLHRSNLAHSLTGVAPPRHVLKGIRERAALSPVGSTSPCKSSPLQLARTNHLQKERSINPSTSRPYMAGCSSGVPWSYHPSADGKKTPTFSETLGTKMANIYVGPQNRHFRIHYNIVCRRVPHFEAILLNTEGDTYAKLPNEDSDSFDVLLEWVYTGKLRPLIVSGVDIRSNSHLVGLNWIPHRLYILAHELKSPELMNDVLNAWIDHDLSHDLFPTAEVIDEIYSMLPAGSPARHYVSWCLCFIRFRNPSRDDVYLAHFPGSAYYSGLGELLRKHPVLEADYKKIITNEKVWWYNPPRDPRKVSRSTFLVATPA